jgi:hypothetical protein
VVAQLGFQSLDRAGALQRAGGNYALKGPGTAHGVEACQAACFAAINPCCFVAIKGGLNVRQSTMTSPAELRKMQAPLRKPRPVRLWTALQPLINKFIHNKREQLRQLKTQARHGQSRAGTPLSTARGLRKNPVSGKLSSSSKESLNFSSGLSCRPLGCKVRATARA